jgi:hypothetical protein
MATITRFYKFYSSKPGNEIGNLGIYPESFFYVGKNHGNYDKMEVWLPHLEVVVEVDLEHILLSANFLRETISSAKLRILSTLAYSATGRLEKVDVSVTISRTIENYVLNMLSFR